MEAKMSEDTESSQSSHSSTAHLPAAIPSRPIHAQSSDIPVKKTQDPLEAYWRERAKFIKHLERRHQKFEKKSRADFDRAKGIKRPKKPTTLPALAPRVVAPIAESEPPDSEKEAEQVEQAEEADTSTLQDDTADKMVKGIIGLAVKAGVVSMTNLSRSQLIETSRHLSV
jgi:hypothetical protein